MDKFNIAPSCPPTNKNLATALAFDQIENAIDERLHLTHSLRVLVRVVVLLLENCLEGNRNLHVAPEHQHDARRDRRAAGARVAHKALQTLAGFAALHVFAVGVRPAETRAGHVPRRLRHLRLRQHAELLVLEAGHCAHRREALTRIARAGVRVL